MASGLPVVAVAAGGLLDIITQPGTTGRLQALLLPKHSIEQRLSRGRLDACLQSHRE